MNSEMKNKFEIIFISSDKSQESFNEYFQEMPWKALPFQGILILFQLN